MKAKAKGKAKIGAAKSTKMTRTGNEKSKGAKAEKGQSAVKKNYKEKVYTNNDN